MGIENRKQVLVPKIDFDENSETSSSEIPKKKKKKNKKPKEDPAVEQNVPTMQIKAAKPIFVQQNFKEVRTIVSQINLQVKPAFKISSTDCTQVLVQTIEDKASIINVLRSKGIQFHTFSEKSEKAKSYVMKGFYEAPVNQVLAFLKEAKVPAVKVSVLVSKPEFTFYLVHFQVEKVNINVLMHNHRKIDSTFIKWEKFKKSNKSPTQCFNCQRWGHSSHGCGYKSRCVKCTEIHAPNQCKRTTRVGNAKCVNCNGDHAASYRLCPTFISYSKRIETSKAKTQVKKLPQVSNLLSSNEFPQLTRRNSAFANSSQVNAANNSSTPHEVINQQQLINNISYAEKLSEAVNNESLLKKFTEAQERLKKIPHIEEAINKFCNFVDEVEKIPSDAPPGTAFNILVKYGFIQQSPFPNRKF